MSQRQSQRDKRPSKGDFNSPNLIKYIKLRPVIWDFNRPDYHDRTAKENAFHDVANMFHQGTTVVSARRCHALWKKLVIQRAARRRQVAAKERSGAASHSMRPYKYSKEMSYLDQIKEHDVEEGSLDAQCNNIKKIGFDEEVEREMLDIANNTGEEDEGEDMEMDDIGDIGDLGDIGEEDKDDTGEEDMEDTEEEMDDTGEDEVDDPAEFCDVNERSIVMESQDFDLKKQQFFSKSSFLKTDKTVQDSKSGALPVNLKTKIGKQKAYALKRQGIKDKLAAKIRSLKEVQHNKRSEEMKSKSSSKEFSNERLLIEELKAMRETDSIGYFCMAMATALRALPHDIATETVQIFMQLIQIQIQKNNQSK